MMFLPTRTRYSESAPYADSIDTIHEDIIDKNFNNQNYSDNLNSNQNLPNQNSISSDYNRNCPHPDPKCSHLQENKIIKKIINPFFAFSSSTLVEDCNFLKIRL